MAKRGKKAAITSALALRGTSALAQGPNRNKYGSPGAQDQGGSAGLLSVLDDVALLGMGGSHGPETAGSLPPRSVPGGFTDPDFYGGGTAAPNPPGYSDPEFYARAGGTAGGAVAEGAGVAEGATGLGAKALGLGSKLMKFLPWLAGGLVAYDVLDRVMGARGRSRQEAAGGLADLSDIAGDDSVADLGQKRGLHTALVQQAMADQQRQATTETAQSMNEQELAQLVMQHQGEMGAYAQRMPSTFADSLARARMSMGG